MTGVRVPVAATTAEAWRSVFGNLSLVLDIAWLPILLLLGASILPRLVILQGAPTLDGNAQDLVSVSVNLVVGLPVMAGLSARWHQQMLFGTTAAVPEGLFRQAWARFLGLTVLAYGALAAVTGVTALVIVSFGVPVPAADTQDALPPWAALVLIVVLAGMLVGVRLSLLFPGAACGRRLRWREAWQLMAGNTWRFIACSLLAVFPVFVIAQALLELALNVVGGGPASLDTSLPLILLAGVLSTLAGILSVVLTASILAIFYRRIVGTHLV